MVNANPKYPLDASGRYNEWIFQKKLMGVVITFWEYQEHILDTKKSKIFKSALFDVCSMTVAFCFCGITPKITDLHEIFQVDMVLELYSQRDQAQV